MIGNHHINEPKPNTTWKIDRQTQKVAQMGGQSNRKHDTGLEHTISRDGMNFVKRLIQNGQPGDVAVDDEPDKIAIHTMIGNQRGKFHVVARKDRPRIGAACRKKDTDGYPLFRQRSGDFMLPVRVVSIEDYLNMGVRTCGNCKQHLKRQGVI